VRPRRVEQALSNLVANALEHAAGGNVAVTLDGRGDRFALRVLDDGHASPPAALPALQEAVARQRSVTSREAPTGLGLAIVGAVQGWTITISPIEPHGVEVRIEGDCDG
jgi:signal transduction histidine kinase